MVINQKNYKIWYEKNKSMILDVFLEYLSMETISPNEYIAYDFLSRVFDELGFETWYERISEKAINHHEHYPLQMSKILSDAYNFKAFYNSNSDRTLLISCHIDVVPPCENAQSTFVPEVVVDEKNNETVYARGACDTKGNIMMLLVALRFLKDNKIPLAYNIEFDGVIEEERGGIGALSTALNKSQQSDIYGVLVLEPTSLKIYKGHRGCLGVTISILGKGGHMGASTIMSPVDSIGDVVESLKELECKFNIIAKNSKVYDDVDRPIQVNIGKIMGGDWHGSTMSECALSINVGFPHNLNVELVEKELHSILNKLEKKTCLRYKLKLDGIKNEAYLDDNNDEFYYNFKQYVDEIVVCNNDIGAWHVSCDARLYANHMHVPTLIFGCGNLEDAHSCEEKLYMPDLEGAAYVLAKYLSDIK